MLMLRKIINRYYDAYEYLMPVDANDALISIVGSLGKVANLLVDSEGGVTLFDADKVAEQLGVVLQQVIVMGETIERDPVKTLLTGICTELYALTPSRLTEAEYARLKRDIQVLIGSFATSGSVGDLFVNDAVLAQMLNLFTKEDNMFKPKMKKSIAYNVVLDRNGQTNAITIWADHDILEKLNLETYGRLIENDGYATLFVDPRYETKDITQYLDNNAVSAPSEFSEA